MASNILRRGKQAVVVVVAVYRNKLLILCLSQSFSPLVFFFAMRHFKYFDCELLKYFQNIRILGLYRKYNDALHRIKK